MIRTLAFIVALVLGGCGSRGTTRSHGDGGAAATSQREEAPVVEADGGPGLVFTWVDTDGHYQVATALADVPEEHRAFVRVQDPELPPGDPLAVWVADLRQARNGQYPVKSLPRSQFEQLTQPRPEPTKTAPAPAAASPTPTGSPASPPAGDSSATRVVMYSTTTCPVCRQARRWLAQQQVSFVERDIDRDENAARELREKARQQGVSANGVPVFEIKGRLIPGFNRQALTQALGG